MPALQRPPALGAFLGGLSVKRVPNSRLLDVTFESTDPALAAHVVNAHLNNFIEQNFRSRFEAATQASNWLAGQLNEMKIKVENAEDARLAYERDNQIWTIDEKNDISTQKLARSEQATDRRANRPHQQGSGLSARAIGELRRHRRRARKPGHSGHSQAADHLERSIHRRGEPVRPQVSQGCAPAGAAEGSRSADHAREDEYRQSGGGRLSRLAPARTSSASRRWTSRKRKPTRRPRSWCSTTS